MNESMIAYCGLDCTVCPAHLAWKTDDDELRVKQAAKWGSPEYPLTAGEINCVGCKADAKPRFKFCKECAVRACASTRGVQTCAHCKDYGCDTLEGLLKQVGEDARQRLETLRSAL